MTIDLRTETASAPRAAEGINLDRLCVAARTVLDRMPDLVAEGLTSTGVATLTRHAKALVDLQGLRCLPRPTLRTHAGAIHEALARLAGEQALTLAVWFDDGLGVTRTGPGNGTGPGPW